MANKNYKIFSALKEKRASIGAGISAPTVQPIAPIKPAAGMPGSGPLAIGGASGMSSVAPPVLGGSGGLSSGTNQPAGFVAGMNQQSQEMQTEQAKALGDAQSQAQAFKKDEELHRTKMELESLKAQTKATQAVSAASPGVSALLPTTAKRVASKANSLFKKTSVNLHSLMPKYAYTYPPKPEVAKPLVPTAAGSGTPGARMPTSVAQGRMYNSVPRDAKQRPSTRTPSPILPTPELRRVPLPSTTPIPVTPGLPVAALPPIPATDTRAYKVNSNKRPNSIPLPGEPKKYDTSKLPHVIIDGKAYPTHEYSKPQTSVSLLDALRGRPEGLSQEAYDDWYINTYGLDPISRGTDPRYYDARSLQKKILGESKTPMEQQQLYAQPWLDPKEGWMQGGSWSPNFKEKLQPGAEKLKYFFSAVPDMAKNTVMRAYDRMLGGGLAQERGRQKIINNAPFVNNADRFKFFEGVKEYGKGLSDVGSVGLNTAALAVPGVGWGTSALTRFLTSMVGPAAATQAAPLLRSESAASPQGLDWHQKARALELGISPDDPDFYNKLTDAYAKYYNSNVPDSVNESLTSIGANAATSPSTTNASTLQGTGYLHGDKIFNPMQSSVGPYQPYQNMLLDLFTPQPQMYPNAGYDPASMMSAFNDSAQRFGAPAYYNQYRDMNKLFQSGNTF